MTWEDFKSAASDNLSSLTFKAVDAFGGKLIDDIDTNTNTATTTGNNGENTPVGTGIGQALPGNIPMWALVAGGVVLVGGVVYLATRKR